MEVKFVSESADQIVLALNLSRAELSAIENDSAAKNKLIDIVLAACPSAEPVWEPADQEEPTEAPFRLGHYKGIRIQRIPDPRGELPTEDLMKEQLLDAIIDCNHIPVSQELIDSETEYELVSRSQMLKYQGMMIGDLSQYFHYGTKEDREEVTREVIRQLKTEIILKSVIEQEQITVSKDELFDRAKVMAQQENISMDMIERFFGKDMELLESDLIKEKALNFLFSCADIIEA